MINMDNIPNDKKAVVEYHLSKLNALKEKRAEAYDAITNLSLGYSLSEKDSFILYEYIRKLENEVYKL